MSKGRPTRSRWRNGVYRRWPWRVRFRDTEEARRLLRLLAKHARVTIGLDQDDAGASGAAILAESLGPVVHVVNWPDHDANDWLRNRPTEATPEAAAALLARAKTYIEVLAAQVGALQNSEREKGLRALCKMVLRLDTFTRDVMRESGQRGGLKLRAFDQLLEKRFTGITSPGESGR